MRCRGSGIIPMIVQDVDCTARLAADGIAFIGEVPQLVRKTVRF